MELRRFRALHLAGVSISAIAPETGHDWRTVKKYLTAKGVVPSAPPRAGPSAPQDRSAGAGGRCLAAS
jgi:transposase